MYVCIFAIIYSAVSMAKSETRYVGVRLSEEVALQSVLEDGPGVDRPYIRWNRVP